MGVGITEFHVFQAASRLVSNGTPSPTNDQVRKELGNTGSKTTITNHMKTWRARYLAPDDNAGLPSPVMLGLSSIYQGMFNDAQAYIDEHEQKADSKVKTAQAEVDKAHKEVRAAQDTIRTLEAQLVAAQGKNQDAQDEISQLKEQAIRQQAKEENLLTAIETERDLKEAAIQEKAAIRKELRQAEQDFNTLRVKLVNSESETRDKIRQLDLEKRQVNDQDTTITRLEEKLSKQHNELQSVLSQLKTSELTAAKSATELKALNKLVNTQERQIEKYEVKLDEINERMQSLQQQDISKLRNVLGDINTLVDQAAEKNKKARKTQKK